MEISLQLPLDYRRAPGVKTPPAGYSFELPIPGDAPEALLAAAFGALLSRYNSSDSIDPDATRIAEFPAGDDLRLAVEAAGGKFRATFLYNPNLFKRTSIERFAGHFTRLLAGLAANPDAPISTLPLLTPQERVWIESTFTGRPRRADPRFVHESFEARAAASPDSTALRFRDRLLTYGELNSRANALARRLAAGGIGAERRVAVCLEPSFEAVIALLAILKAGGAYVPLDPAAPIARLRASLDDIQPSLLIARTRLDARIATLTPEEIGRLPEEFSGDNLGLPVDPEQTAYIYYTSGSTGKPKGAMASQANLRYYIETAREAYRIGPADVIPAIARFSFSISMLELMSPLAAGGVLIILDREHVLDMDRMSRTLGEATFFHAGPGLLKNLIAHIKRHYPDRSAFSRLRHASTGGDMVPPEILEGLKQVFPNAEVFVIYGCSEATPMGCEYPVSRDHRAERTYVGRPYDNTIVRVLDSDRNLLPVGVPGQIYFSGPGVGKGYLNEPDMTREKFIDIGGRRFYGTGDTGRLSEDGWVEFLGRSDFQIKLRGIRIELGEVEHALRGAPGVLDGAVAAKRMGSGEKSLVAYVVMDREASGLPEKNARIAAVRRSMEENLPDYMVPAVYIELPQLPLNHNMKLDRRALPEPEQADRRGGSDSRFRAPRTQTEKRLAALWEGLLGLERVGVDDYFFDLGGESLLGLQLILEVERSLGVRLDGMDVLRETLEVQAAICDRRLGKAASGPALPAAAPGDFEIFHFGEDKDLYGVLEGPVGAASEAVLICGPVGYEWVRTQFILKRLAKLLADKGVPSLRFHFYGCGDSLGESSDGTRERWRGDIAAAHRELKRRTGAAKIRAVGVRLGATLLRDVSGDLSLADLVLWDPVAPDPLGAGGSVKRFSAPDCDPGWEDAARIEQILPDSGIADGLAAMLTERA